MIRKLGVFKLVSITRTKLVAILFYTPFPTVLMKVDSRALKVTKLTRSLQINYCHCQSPEKGLA